MPRYTDTQIIKALQDTKGMVYVAAQRLGCSPDTIKARLAKSQKIRAVAEAERGKMGDTAELKLIQAIQAGQPWAVTFYLKTQAKDRGYTERMEVTGNDGTDITIRVVYDDADHQSTETA